MKRVVSGRSGRETYGAKWQNNETTSSSSENEDGEDAFQSASQTTSDLTPEGISRGRIHLSNIHDSMFRATLEGDCVAVEMLLEGNPKLASDKISEEGDRALHVAAAIKHKEIVRKLVEKMSEEELALLDGNGYTACCYAAISGAVGIADLMLRKSPTLATARDRENKTPLYKAAFRGNAKMVSYFLKYAEVEDLSMEEWFDLLLVAIRREMYDAALKILGSNEQVATMRNDEGTALHLLAKQRFFVNRKERNAGAMCRGMSLLANKLWTSIQRLGQGSAVELMKNPPILHDATEVGNVELVTMITHTYPLLVWHTNNQGYTIFHITVKYRIGNLFGLIDEIGARKDLIAVSQDENGNNILHLAAKLGPPDWMYRIRPAFRLHRETMWFKEVEAIVPPLCWEMRNNEGHTPKELFLKEHKSLLEKNTTWTRNTADSWMLISTLIFSVVFASTFAVPGGYNQETGIPILFRSNWITCFVVFEALAMFLSAFSVLWFSRTMMASEEDLFNDHPYRIRGGLVILSLSVVGVVSVFMSAYFLIYAEERGALVKAVIVFVYILLVYIVLSQNVRFHRHLSRRMLPKWNRHSLFKPHAYTVGESF